MTVECSQTGGEATAPAKHAPDAAAAARQAPPPKTVIDSQGGWQPVKFKELWNFRDLIYILAWRDIKVRYKQTLLGAAWGVLQPALLMVVFTVFLGQVAAHPESDIPYPLFVYLGLLPWTFFATGLTSVGNSLVSSEQLLTKVYFPRLAIPVASLGAVFVDFAVAFLFLLVLLACYGVAPSRYVVLVPVVVVLMTFTTLGAGTLLAALNVTYRDVRYVIPFLVQLWMFATPIIYVQSGAAGRGGGSASPATRVALSLLADLNPMTGLIGFFRAAVLGDDLPWLPLAYSVGVSAALLAAGCFYFRRVEDSFADVI